MKTYTYKPIATPPHISAIRANTVLNAVSDALRRIAEMEKIMESPIETVAFQARFAIHTDRRKMERVAYANVRARYSVTAHGRAEVSLSNPEP
jgi:hypothetical protein